MSSSFKGVPSQNIRPFTPCSTHSVSANYMIAGFLRYTGLPESEAIRVPCWPYLLVGACRFDGMC